MSNTVNHPELYVHLYPEVVKLYTEENLTAKQISEKLNIGATTVNRILKRNNIDMNRIYHNKYYFNENAFDSNNPETAYWIGFLLTDGCVHEYTTKHCSPCITLQLKESDKSILEEYAKFLEYQGLITQDKIKRWKISINSYKLAEDLIKFNVTPRKTFYAKAPEIFEDNNLFWRGVMDGDGSMWSGEKGILRINLTSASLDLIEQFQEYCNNILDNSSNVNITSFFTKEENEMYRVVYTGNFALRILDIIYKDNGPKLDRKYNKYISYKENNYALV
jgi:hypothetical protein